MATTAAFVAGQQFATGAVFRLAERPGNSAGAAPQSVFLKQPLQASSASAFATGGSQLSHAGRPEHRPARAVAPKTVAKKISAAVSTAAPAQGERQAQTAKKPVDTKRTVIITGASSGLGLATAKKLAKSGEWHVILACRDFLKAERAAKAAGLPKDSYTTLHIDLSSLESVRQFVKHFRATERKLDVLVANAAVYLPTAKEPRFTAEGFELSVGTNHLGHFLLVNLLLEDLEKNRDAKPRVIIVGSITGNTNTLAGNVPPKANLGDLSGLAAGLSETSPSVMIDGGEFDGAKAYKDSKVCNMLTVRELHRRYHDKTGITFSSLYPGCIAETGLFREHYGIFKTLFPLFQKYVTKGYVSEDTAGERLAQVVSDPKLGASGNYWSWNNDQSSFVNDVSDEVADSTKGQKLWEVSEKLVGLK